MTCPTCNGRGHGPQCTICPTCDGSGQIIGPSTQQRERYELAYRNACQRLLTGTIKKYSATMRNSLITSTILTTLEEMAKAEGLRLDTLISDQD
jgi:hypothetical protein